jgi:hypothetical protein
MQVRYWRVGFGDVFIDDLAPLNPNKAERNANPCRASQSESDE